MNENIYSADPIEVIATVTGTRRSAETAVRNGADREIYAPEDFVETIRAAADEDDATDYSKILTQANAGELRWEGAHNGFYNGIPFVWLHG